MKKTYCDRCGKEIFLEAHAVIGHRVFKGCVEIDPEDKRYDLCKKCNEAFESFMNGGEGDG